MSEYTFKIKPSTCIEGYYVHKCERNLLYNGISGRVRKDFKLDDPTGSGSSIAALAGEEWEKTIITNYIEAKDLHKKTETVNGKISYLKYSCEETIEELKIMERSVRRNHGKEYLYQGRLSASDDSKKEWLDLDEDLLNGKDEALFVDMSETYPDLIRAEWDGETQSVVLSVIDAKLTKRMKLAHKVQVAMYVRLLKGLVEDHNKGKNEDEKLNVTVNENEGYLWNSGQEAERPFKLKEIDDLLSDYFEYVLPAFIKKLHKSIRENRTALLKDEVERCVGPKCEWCENCRQCHEELKETGSMRLIPYLTEYAQDHAEKSGAPETVSELKTFIEDIENRQLLSCNRTWDYILSDGSTIDVQEKAAPYTWDTIRKNGYSKKNVKSLTMPRWQDVTVILTAQKYAGNGRVYALGLYKIEYQGSAKQEGTEQEGTEQDGTEKDTKKWEYTASVFIAEDISEENYYRTAGSFIESLHGVIESCHNENSEISDERQKSSLQGYVMDPYEQKNLEEVLIDVLESDLDMSLKEKTMEILFWIQGEKLVETGYDQPCNASEFPLIQISGELKKLLSLPLAVAYRLPEVVAAMNVWMDADKRFTKEDFSEFFEAVSNVMRSDAIHEAWLKKDREKIKKIEEHIIKRFCAEWGILYKLQREGRENNMIIRNLSGFSLPGRIGYQNELLKKWYFEMKLENLLAYHQIRKNRLADLYTAMENGAILKMKIESVEKRQEGDYTNTYIRLKMNNLTGEFRGDCFSAVMVRESDLDKLYGFDDYRNSGIFPKFYGCDQKIVGILNFLEFEKEGKSLVLSGKLSRNSFYENDEGQYVYVSARYTDFNSDKIMGGFELLDKGIGKDLLTPSQMDIRLEEDYPAVEKELLNFSHPDNMDFTDSQKKAFENLYERQLTVLQGPPGTGKTDFIARAVITLCRYFHQEKNKDLRVLISANSHAAIENVLFMIEKKLGKERDISLYKVDKFDDGSKGQKGTIRTAAKKKGKVNTVYDMMDGEDVHRPLAAGATNWSCADMKADAGERYFDLIIIDEASQVRVMDAMLALNMGKPGVTRYLLVGDSNQLPAIIQGQYGKDSDEGYKYGSVFDFFRAALPENDLMLCDNFRMNEVLLRYSAEKIYDERYSSFNDEIAKRRLLYNADAGVTEDFPEWLNYILDGFSNNEEDYWPLVFCRVSGSTPLKQSDAEVMIVTMITKALRETAGCKSDEFFWQGDEDRDGILGIVSPHHSHIEKLKDELVLKTGMKRDDLYIGTVDKLQGQQRDAVIVSYGVTDLESAVTEGEFIFNRNRLNVALTRAKCKNITVFSEILTKASPGMLDTEDEDLQYGLEYVCGFNSFMKRSESDTETDHKQFVPEGDEFGGVVIDIYRKRMKKGFKVERGE